MDIKITSGSTWVGIGDRTFPKNALTYQVNETTGQITIERESTGRVVCTESLEAYKDSNNTRYANVAALDSDLKSKLFA